MNNITLCITLLLLPVTLMAAALLPGDAERGKTLHNSNCVGCHTQMTAGKPDTLYTRSNRRVNSVGGLISQVAGCNKMQKIGLDENERNDVVKYLNDEFYKFTD